MDRLCTCLRQLGWCDTEHFWPRQVKAGLENIQNINTLQNALAQFEIVPWNRTCK